MIADISLFAAFFAGLLSFLSPCVLPLVPPYLAYLAGFEAHELADPHTVKQARKDLLIAAFAFVFGFSTVFIALGATASFLGELLRAHLSLLSTLAGVFILVMGLHFLGVFRLMPLYREVRFSMPQGSGPLAGYGMGLAFAFGWTPCIGPVLATILAVAGSESSVTGGAILLALYSAGLGIPFLVAALVVHPFMTWFKGFRHRLPLIQKIMGGLLVLTGLAFLMGWITDASFWLLETFPTLQKLG